MQADRTFTSKAQVTRNTLTSTVATQQILALMGEGNYNFTAKYILCISELPEL